MPGSQLARLHPVEQANVMNERRQFRSLGQMALGDLPKRIARFDGVKDVRLVSTMRRCRGRFVGSVDPDLRTEPQAGGQHADQRDRPE